MNIYNFGAGPAMLPKPVIEKAQKELPNWHNGMSVMEVGHRTPAFMNLASSLKEKVKTLLAVPDTHEVLFLPGGARLQFALLPMNFVKNNQTGNYVLSGYWSECAAKEAEAISPIHIAASMKETGYQTAPIDKDWKISPDASYVHFTDNETIHGVEFHKTPKVSRPLVTDMTSSLFSKPLDIDQYHLIYASAQKNIGPAGMTVVIINKAWVQEAKTDLPKMFSYQNWLETDSMYNTPVTFSWYVANLVLEWLIEQGGVNHIYKKNINNAQRLYDLIDNSQFYHNPVAADARSRMNVPFLLSDSSLESKFLSEAENLGLMQLKGHRLVGGLRASLYNAMPEEGVDALINFMKDFEHKN